MSVTLATLSDAIEWANARWANQRMVPSRLHSHVEEGIGLGFTNAFRAALDGRANTIISKSRTVECWHPLLAPRRPPRDCPECSGTRVKEQRSELYAYPMSLALEKLSNGLVPKRQPHPFGLVVVLASHGWLPKQAARALALPWSRAETQFLEALRLLHSHYQEGPVDTRTSTGLVIGWLTMSESQRHAVEAGEQEVLANGHAAA